MYRDAKHIQAIIEAIAAIESEKSALVDVKKIMPDGNQFRLRDDPETIYFYSTVSLLNINPGFHSLGSNEFDRDVIRFFLYFPGIRYYKHEVYIGLRENKVRSIASEFDVINSGNEQYSVYVQSIDSMRPRRADEHYFESPYYQIELNDYDATYWNVNMNLTNQTTLVERQHAFWINTNCISKLTNCITPSEFITTAWSDSLKANGIIRR